MFACIPAATAFIDTHREVHTEFRIPSRLHGVRYKEDLQHRIGYSGLI